MSIVDKLKLSKYENMAVLHNPEGYEFFEEQAKSLSEKHDAIFIFVKTIEEMAENLNVVLGSRFYQRAIKRLIYIVERRSRE
ncbi:hypothetical protein [Guptibacillus algicola]|uniref:hypothetical protein n=1 Tax=Guptibacillus algicola TaxID=225844 RepID=UPI001CD764C2|nr:hypothetical protein [Alkalihalobacillus algicola]MCA0985671.1 hypothetical protein [Alkalihalobacillus algicola]